MGVNGYLHAKGLNVKLLASCGSWVGTCYVGWKSRGRHTLGAAPGFLPWLPTCLKVDFLLRPPTPTPPTAL